jgi:hypothetical protein
MMLTIDFNRIAASCRTRAYKANKKSTVVAISTAKIFAFRHHLVKRFIESSLLLDRIIAKTRPAGEEE